MKKLMVIVAVMSVFTSIATAMNVRDFGAKGDGVTDDTKALQSAADAAFAKQVLNPPQVTRFWLTGWDCPEEEIYFPTGSYKITAPIVFHGNVTLRGGQGAKIVNPNSATNSLVFVRTLRVSLQQLELVGGAVQVDHWTANADTATLLISDCKFTGANEVALYSVGRNGEPNSTSIIIERSRFVGMARAVKMSSDGIIIRDCEFAAISRENAAVLELGTVSNLMRSRIGIRGEIKSGQCAVRLLGAQSVVSEVGIAAEGDLTAFECMMMPRTHYAVPKMSLTNIRLNTGKAPVIRYPEGMMAQMTIVNGLSAIHSSGRQRVFAFDREPSAAEVEDWARADRIGKTKCKIPPMRLRACFSITLHRINSGDFDAELPASLRQFVREPIAGARLGYEDRHAPVREEWPEIVGVDMGSDSPNAVRDDTDKLKALLAKAAAMDGATVVLPSKWLSVQGPIAIPPKTQLTARGRALVRVVNDQALFTIDRADDVRLENLAITRGKHAVVINDRQGLVRLRNCYFYDQLKASILAPAEQSALRIELTGGIAYTPYFYDGAANPMLIDGTWYSTAPNRPKGENEKSYFSMVNRVGGRLLMYDILGVPCYFGNIPMGEIENDGVATVGHYAWVSNRGTLRIVNSRLGGEWNGLTMVYSLGDKTSTYIEGGADACYSRWLKPGKSHVVVNDPDASVTMVDVTGFDYFSSNRAPLVVYLRDDGSFVPADKCVNDGTFPFDYDQRGCQQLK